MNVIEVNNLKKHFKSVKAVDGISFAVQKGEVFGFLGPNGAGKTTTIRCLMDFLRPTDGEVKILGLDYSKDGCEIRKRIGYVSGDVRLYEGWTGYDHIRFLEKIRWQKSIAEELIQRLDFNPKLKFKTLSSGNKQKLGLIIALMFNPEIIIMDEPTMGLDPLLQNYVYELLLEFQKRGSTIFFSSHNLAEVDRICNRVGVIKDGKLVTTESIDNLKEKRMHIVKVTFDGLFNQSDFSFDGVEIRQAWPEGLVLGVKGNVNPLIQKLASYNIKSIEVSRASLEEIFLEFYGDRQRDADKAQIDHLNEIPNIGADNK